MKKYEILEFYEDQGQIVVQFDNGMVFNIDLTVEDNKYPEGKGLDELIMSYYPSWIDIRKEEVTSVKNSSNIKKLVKMKEVDEEPALEQPEPVVQDQPTISIEEQEELQRDAIKEIVLSVLKELKVV